MKSIQIADQPRLSLARTVRITIDGIRYRLFRASVTVAVIAVAVAFLMNILSESLFKRAVATDTQERIAKWRMIHDWMARVTVPGTKEMILSELADAEAKPDDPVYVEIATIGRLAPADMETFHSGARLVKSYFAFFDDLDYARRRSLVHTAVGVGIIERLRTEEGLEQFAAALKNIRSVRFPTDMEQLNQFLATWPELEALVEKVQKGRQTAIAAVTEARGDNPILEALADAEGEFGAAIRRAGFEFDPKTVAPEVGKQAQRLLDVRFLEKSMEQRLARQVIAQHFNVLPADVNVMMMWKMLRSKKQAGKYLAKLQESDLEVSRLDAERLVWLADTTAEGEILVRAERRTSGIGKGWMGMGERMSWLLIVSMLVCGIGISNAMLMSVTERFTEIATLKCLGALDGFIMLMFVLESCFLGIAGGTVGAVAGNIIGTGRMLAAFGLAFLRSMPILDLFLGMAVAVILGVILAAVAAVYPALKAARLAPMEAMRIE